MYRKNTYLSNTLIFLTGLSTAEGFRKFNVECPRTMAPKPDCKARQAIYKVSKECGIDVITKITEDGLKVRRVN